MFSGHLVTESFGVMKALMVGAACKSLLKYCFRQMAGSGVNAALLVEGFKCLVTGAEPFRTALVGLVCDLLGQLLLLHSGL